MLQLPVEIRLAVKSDIPKLEWYGQYAHFRALFRRAYREQERGRRLMLIADCARFPVGQVFVQLTSGDTLVADGQTRAYFYSFRVMEMFRGHGVGTRLLEEAESQVRERGFQWTTIAVTKENIAARRLYERLGYAVFRDDPGVWSYRDQHGRTRHVHEPAWLMEKQLPLY